MWVNADSGKFWGAVTVSDGRVIFFPWSSSGVGVFDFVMKTFDLIKIDLNGKSDIVQKFVDPTVDEKSGKVIFPPNKGKSIGIFDPRNDSFELVDISSSAILDIGNFYSSLLADDGRIFFSPSTLDSIGILKLESP